MERHDAFIHISCRLNHSEVLSMGKQVNFYMMESDESQFIEFARTGRDLCIIPFPLRTASVPCLAELPKLDIPFWYSVCLWDRSGSTDPALRYVSQQKYWIVDELNSEVIVFSRSIIDQGRLVRGRIWAEFIVWKQSDPPERLRKSKAFENWFDRLGRWIKRHSTRDANGDYILPGAIEYQRQGGKLVQEVFANSVRIVRHDL
jgi:hypothetical protein